MPFCCQACFLNVIKVTSNVSRHQRKIVRMSTKRFELNSTAFDYITPQVCSRSSAIKERRAARRLLHKSVGLAFYFTGQSGRSSKRGFAPIVFLKHRQIMAMKTLAICLFFHCSLGYSLRLRSCRSISHFKYKSPPVWFLPKMTLSASQHLSANTVYLPPALLS